VAAAPVILFDGVCNLCNGLVAFVIRHDPAPGRFRFAALQSPTGRSILTRHGLSTEDFDTFVLADGGRVWLRSSAALRVVRALGLPWSLLWALVVVPRPLRDAAYAWVARHRYGWWGRRAECMVPTPELQGRFV
jgi:predicted DCC family thiol-disulfide oxidoreductase YuxK